MRPIGPHEYDYLSWPYLSSGADMLEYTLQHLCFTGALDLHYWKVAAHPKNPRPVVRLFLARGSAVVPLSTAEAFALSLVPADRPIHLGELRVRMKKEVTDAESFKFDQVRKSFGKTDVLKGVNLDIADGEFIVLLGASGCGKSTLLRIIAGLERPTSGHVLIGGEVVDHLPPARRGIAMVFQSYALYPHLDVAGNWALGLKQAGESSGLKDLGHLSSPRERVARLCCDLRPPEAGTARMSTISQFTCQNLNVLIYMGFHNLAVARYVATTRNTNHNDPS